jgi:DNA mismatch repair protein MSH6
MVLDATALSALEVLETLEGTYKGSLLEFLDNTNTGSGFRLLKQWVCAPLYDGAEIRTRQETVEFFIRNQDLAQQLSSGLKHIPMDLERVTARVWSYALQAERFAVMYDDMTAKRLGEFKTLLKCYKQCIGLITKTFANNQAIPSRLSKLAKTPNKGGVFPDLEAVIDQLSGSVVEGTDPKNGRPKCHPQVGADEKYDAICKKIDGVKQRLDAELRNLKAMHPGANFTYAHRLPGFRYEVDCEEKAVPSAFLNKVDVTSRPKGRVRFQTDSIKKSVAELDALEDQQGDCIFPFLSRLFQKFHGHQAPFRAALRCLAEIDALLSLAAASQKFAGTSCCPEILIPEDPKAPAVLELKECRHPVAASLMGNGFVPNDTVMNAGGVPGVLVVTGPNMGGKSTVLRQTCIAVLMAQLGCRVNARACRMSPVDRIFTRIGSYDTILEGKSTLLIELEETAAVMAHGSHRSLAVLDELGRGTSTFDGAAIASAVLDHLKDNVGCMVLFATHYHPVSRAAAQSPKVAPFHMAANAGENNQMTFLYRFLPGLCPASYGHNVAKLAGLPESVLQEALARSAEFERGEGVDAAELQTLAAARDEAGLRALYKRLHPVMAGA